jgi:hypothetical protein
LRVFFPSLENGSFLINQSNNNWKLNLEVRRVPEFTKKQLVFFPHNKNEFFFGLFLLIYYCLKSIMATTTRNKAALRN